MLYDMFSPLWCLSDQTNPFHFSFNIKSLLLPQRKKHLVSGENVQQIQQRRLKFDIFPHQ